MQVSVQNLGKLERRIVVRIPAANVDSKIQQRLRELSQTVRLKGFRPGKVPPRVIEQRFGPQVREEALADAVRSSYQEAVKQQNLRPAVAPAITTNRPEGAGEIEFTATFEVVPELGNIDVATLSLARVVSSVEDADIDRMIETLRQQRRAWNPVERSAQTGDMVLFEYVADLDGTRHPAEGRERAGTIVGSGALFAEFEQQLDGVKTGDERRATLAFPAAFRDAALAGRSAAVEIHVIRVQEPKLPIVDEEFGASFGVKEGGLARFRQEVRANLERELAAAIRGRLRTETVEKLVALYQDIDVPRGMVENEARSMLAQAQEQARRSGATPPVDAGPFAPLAERRVRAFLLLNEIARQNSIVPEQKRISEALATIASTYEEPEKVIELYTRDPELMNQLRNRVLEDQVVDWVAERARVSDQPLSFQDVMQAQLRT
jgi:trigger factor